MQCSKASDLVYKSKRGTNFKNLQPIIRMLILSQPTTQGLAPSHKELKVQYQEEDIPEWPILKITEQAPCKTIQQYRLHARR